MHALIYWHGHSVGGTNPSLLEAMAARAFIASHDNPFNNAVLGEDSLKFTCSDSVAEIINNTNFQSAREKYIRNNLKKIRDNYLWEIIIGKYEESIIKSLRQ